MAKRWASIVASSTARVIVAAGLTLALATTALAFWTTAGSGHASGTTGSAQTVTLSPGTPTAPLYPGGQGDVVLTISNPNAFSVHVGSLSLSAGQGTGGFQVDTGHAGCSTSALSFTTQTHAGTGWSVPPKVGATNGSLSLDLAGAVAMSAGAASACQGATLDVYLTAGP